jgi:aryl-alcohol dehydrogenase-like predicted oxidoreductase
MSCDPPRESLSRREFLAATAAGAVVASAASAPPEPAKLPQKKLGKTGVSVPPLGLGTAPAGFLPEKEAVALYHACMDAGVTYLDTAPALGGYGDAQKFLAPVLKARRDQAFVVTKCFEPDGEKALALLKKNLKEMGIDRADLVYAHSIGADEMPPEKVFGKGGVCEALTKAKKDGLTRFVGVSGHNRPDRFLQALKEWDYDVQMNAVSLVARHVYDFESKVWPAAAKKGVGLAAMKVYGGAPGGKDWSARLPDELRRAAFRYALGLPEVAVVVLGMKSADELNRNLEWLKAYKPLAKDELAALEGPTKELAKKWGALYGAVT